MSKLKNKVVVITGASSGIGRDAALAFARKGATVVLNARRAAALDELARECREFGVDALPFPADVSNEKEVEDLARAAVSNFGRIDVWVNNAAVTLFGRTEEVPLKAYKRVIETNFFGYVNGARAAIPRFREQGYGTLINVSSVVGKTSSPYVGAYSASKFAINGLSEALRMELQDAPNIHVCTVLPSSIDTPLFQHGANYSGRAVKPLDPVIDADRVAKAILRLVHHPRREVTVGGSARMMHAIRAVAPPMGERMTAKQVEAGHFRSEPAPPSEGNLFKPSDEWNTVSGGWRKKKHLVNGKAKCAAITAVGLVGLILLKRARSRQRIAG